MQSKLASFLVETHIATIFDGQEILHELPSVTVSTRVSLLEIGKIIIIEFLLNRCFVPVGARIFCVSIQPHWWNCN